MPVTTDDDVLFTAGNEKKELISTRTGRTKGGHFAFGENADMG